MSERILASALRVRWIPSPRDSSASKPCEMLQTLPDHGGLSKKFFVEAGQFSARAKRCIGRAVNNSRALFKKILGFFACVAGNARIGCGPSGHGQTHAVWALGEPEE